MSKGKSRANNNILAVLAIVIITVSSVNFLLAFNTIKQKEALTAAASSPYATGYVGLCASFVPNITAATYHYAFEDTPYFYDVNCTNENTGLVIYSDDSGLFNISQATGDFNFTPTNDDVGIYTVLITTRETVCNSLSDSKTIIINVSNVNDIPNLVSIVLRNLTSGTGNATYNFPVISPIEIWEDVWYNLSVIAVDQDTNYGDSITYGVMWNVWPGSPGSFQLFQIDENTGRSQPLPFMPAQQDVGYHSADFYVYDKELEIDTEQNVSFVIHNMNDPPILGLIGAQTSFSGEPYFLDVNATDEDGDTLVYNVSFLWCLKINTSDTNCTIFSIDSSTGFVSLTPPLVDVGNYNVNFTVFDGATYDWENVSFTVLEFGNHPPNITRWYPEEGNVSMDEGGAQYFNITKSDPDGTTPSVQWYVNGVARDGETSDEFYFYASYTSSGVYNVTVVITDGLLDAYHEWRLLVFDRPPPPPPAPAPILKGSKICLENWRCTEWSACSSSGLQIRGCIDLHSCNSTLNKPPEKRKCIYTPFPSCFDAIQNCHDGGCEVLVDCGGPCPPCPTCSDGIKNCHIGGACEEGTDCGGPCSPCVPEPYMAVCGNGICEGAEISSCMEDCLGFWLDMGIFLMIIVLLVVVSVLLYVYRKETVLLYVYKKMRGE